MTQRQYEQMIGLANRLRKRGYNSLAQDRQLLTSAAQLARRGHYQEAETMIAVLPLDGPLGPETLDLKAKICAQQGRLVEAQFCWMEAVRQSPGNASYRRALDYLTRQVRPSQFLLIAMIAVVIVTAAILVVLRLEGLIP